MTEQSAPEARVREIRRRTRRRFSAEEKIRIVLEGLKGEESIAECTSSTTLRLLRSELKRHRLDTATAGYAPRPGWAVPG